MNLRITLAIALLQAMSRILVIVERAILGLLPYREPILKRQCGSNN
ncbi:hypothetical protein [Calothrix sp. CCY 0018]